jgi:hypothetical protein
VPGHELDWAVTNQPSLQKPSSVSITTKYNSIPSGDAQRYITPDVFGGGGRTVQMDGGKKVGAFWTHPCEGSSR